MTGTFPADPAFDYHVHLFGVLTPDDVFELGKDRFRRPSVQQRIAWCETEYERAFGRRIAIADYWLTAGGYDDLCRDLLMLEAGDFHRFQARFNILIALFRIENAEDVEAPRRAMRRQMHQGVRGAQYRMLLPPGLDHAGQHRFLENLCRAAAELNAESGGSFDPSVAVSLSRFPDRSEEELSVVTAVRAGEYGAWLTAIDFCQFEEGYPPAGQRGLIAGMLRHNKDVTEQPVRGRGGPPGPLEILYHVGETFMGMSIMSSVRWVWEAAAMGCHRLGHCLSLGIDPDGFLGSAVSEPASERLAHIDFLLGLGDAQATALGMDPAALRRERSGLGTLPPGAQIEMTYDEARVQEIRRLQDYVMERIRTETEAVIEVCPTSNLRIGALPGMHGHPVSRFHRENMRYVIGSDDPGIFSTTLADEVRLAEAVV